MGVISFHVISNRMELDPCQSKVKLSWLLQLQHLFSAQLPRMPKEYITRLVFDYRHKNLVVVKKRMQRLDLCTMSMLFIKDALSIP